MPELVHDPDRLKLGKKLGHVEDRRALYFADFIVKRALPAHPKTQRVGTGVDFPMFANDDLGVCAFASRGHGILAHEKSSRQRGELALTDQDVVDAYSAVTGYQPGRPETDRGTYMVDALNYFRKVGLGRERDGSRHTIGAFVKLDPANRTELKVAQWLFGGLYLGLWLPTSAQRQQRWDVTTGPGAAAGSWGGHAITTVNYDEAGVTLATWGARKRASWRFIHEYCDEAYCLLSEDFLTTSGRTPQGFDVASLNDALGELGR